MGQRVRGNRCYHESVHRWHEDGTSRRKGISSRAGRRGYNETVRLVTGNEDLIDKDIAMIQSGDGGFPYNNVVQRVIASHARTFADDLAVHHGTRFCLAATLFDFL